MVYDVDNDIVHSVLYADINIMQLVLFPTHHLAPMLFLLISSYI